MDSEVAPKQQRPFRLRKRVYFVAFGLLLFFWYSGKEEGLGGLLAWFVGIALLRICWEIAWQLVLKDVPFLKTARRVLFKWKEEEERPLPKKRRVEFD